MESELHQSPLLLLAMEQYGGFTTVEAVDDGEPVLAWLNGERGSLQGWAVHLFMVAHRAKARIPIGRLDRHNIGMVGRSRQKAWCGGHAAEIQGASVGPSAA